MTLKHHFIMGHPRGRKLWHSCWMVTILICFGSETMVKNVISYSTDSSYVLFTQSEYPRDCAEVLERCSFSHNTSGVYMIKPDGYPEPFEVYCEKDVENNGWTILQRRSSGHISFNRKWEDFKIGFGFLGSDFWMGNDKIAFLTNQREYQLRLEFQNALGQTYYVAYDNFRISDEWGRYEIQTISSFRGTSSSHIEWCPVNEVFSNETCERTCDDPENCISRTVTGELEKCVCTGEYKIHNGNCISDNQCSCFIADIGDVLPNGNSYVNSDCSRRWNCSNNRLNVEENYRCSDDATCDERNGVRRCYCNEGFEGNGVTCTRDFLPKDCQELYDDDRSDGVYTIYPDGFPEGVQVRCDMETNVGGWTIFQRRFSASVDFNRDWLAYKNGFGNSSENHWLGNKYIHAMTNQKTYQLRIDVRDSRSSNYHALYSTFSINDETDKYRLSVGSYSGNAGFNALGNHNNKQFSTRDEDNDAHGGYHCAQRHTGGWWFYYRGCHSTSCSSTEDYCDWFSAGSCGCASCADCNLNGDYDGSSRATNILWNSLDGYDCGIQYTEMKIRPM